MTELYQHTEKQLSGIPLELQEPLKLPQDVPEANVARAMVAKLLEQLRRAPDGKVVMNADMVLELIKQGEQYADLMAAANQPQTEIDRSDGATVVPVPTEATPLRLVPQPDDDITTDHIQVA